METQIEARNYKPSTWKCNFHFTKHSHKNKQSCSISGKLRLFISWVTPWLWPCISSPPAGAAQSAEWRENSSRSSLWTSGPTGSGSCWPRAASCRSGVGRSGAWSAAARPGSRGGRPRPSLARSRSGRTSGGSLAPGPDPRWGRPPEGCSGPSPWCYAGGWKSDWTRRLAGRWLSPRRLEKSVGQWGTQRGRNKNKSPEVTAHMGISPSLQSA